MNVLNSLPLLPDFTGNLITGIGSNANLAKFASDWFQYSDGSLSKADALIFQFNQVNRRRLTC